MSRPLALAALSAFLVMLGLGVLFPVLPAFSRELGLSDLQYAALLASYPAVGALVSPAWGGFSERFGRKPAIIIGLLGFGGGFGAFALGETFAELLAARLVGGLFSAAALPAVFAFAADVSTPERRGVAMGAIGAAIGLGVMFGPLMGVVLVPYGLRVPYFASSAIGLGAALLVALLLPESLTDEVRARAAAERENAAEKSGVRARLRSHLVFSFLTSTARLGIDVTVGFLILDKITPGATAEDAVQSTGKLLFAMGTIAVLIQGGGLRALSRRFSDRGLLLFGTAAMATGITGVAAATDWTSLVAAGSITAVGFALMTPTFNAMLSRAAAGHQGLAQGYNSTAQQLSRVVGPLVLVQLYQWMPQAPYLFAGAICFGALALAFARIRDDVSAPPYTPGGGS